MCFRVALALWRSTGESQHWESSEHSEAHRKCFRVLLGLSRSRSSLCSTYGGPAESLWSTTTWESLWRPLSQSLLQSESLWRPPSQSVLQSGDHIGTVVCGLSAVCKRGSRHEVLISSVAGIPSVVCVCVVLTPVCFCAGSTGCIPSCMDLSLSQDAVVEPPAARIRTLLLCRLY